MACDFSVAQDLALFGQAGPRHGSAPDGGSTDFLPLFVGIEAAMESCTLCEHWSAHKAHAPRAAHAARAGAQGGRRASCRTRSSSPTAGSTTGPDRLRRARRTGADARRGQGAAGARARSTSSLLDARGGRARLQARRTRCPAASPRPSRACASTSSSTGTATARATAPGSALNMMTEGRAGFRAFHEGSKALPRGRLPAAAPPAGRGRDVGRARSSDEIARRRRAATESAR